MSDRTVTCRVVADPDHPGELLLDLGRELCERMGWQPGDQLQWIDNKDGSWILTKHNTISPAD